MECLNSKRMIKVTTIAERAIASINKTNELIVIVYNSRISNVVSYLQISKINFVLIPFSSFSTFLLFGGLFLFLRSSPKFSSLIPIHLSLLYDL